MRKRIRVTRQTPAIVIAVLALVAGLTGAAVAQPAAKKPLTTSKVKKIAKKQITKLAPGLSVATADQLGNVTVQKQDFTVADNTANGALASCSAGQEVISGGVITGANDSYITNSVPANAVVGDLSNGQTFTGWRGFVVNQLGGSGTITSTVYAVCAG